MTDQVRLTLPAEEDFRQVAHLVVGGLGVRLDLTFEDLDDLQVALEALLGCRDDEGDIVVTVDAGDGMVRASVGRSARAHSTRSSGVTRPSGCTACSRRCATRLRSTNATAARGWS